MAKKNPKKKNDGYYRPPLGNNKGATNYSVTQPSVLPKGLPKKTRSLCPECLNIIDARIFEEDGKVYIDKTCPDHGYVKDVYWSDVEQYLAAEKHARDGIHLENPNVQSTKECPGNCGLCDMHFSHTCLAIVDLTNRCNFNCPICFANANDAGYVYEPDYDTIIGMLKQLRDERPVPCPAVQFSGGEPTIYPRILDVIQAAWDMGFMQTQIATNGLTLATKKGFAQQLADHHLHSVYLQFDSLRDDYYEEIRGRKNLTALKDKAVENCRGIKPVSDDLERKVKPTTLSTILVPTVVNTLNDSEVGDILRYAIKNIDVIRGVNYQPVAFTGRIDDKERESQRFTLPDLVNRLTTQTDGWFRKEDFYSVPCVTPISELTSIIQKNPKVAFTAHPHCGWATYVFVHKNEVTPIPRFFKVEKFFSDMEQMAQKYGQDTLGNKMKLAAGGLFAKSDKLKASYMRKQINKYYIPDEAPPELDKDTVVDLVTNVFMGGNKEALADFAWNTLFIGGMHFQDAYNYDTNRVARCVIHYSVPGGRIIPFCAYNGGPFYRREVESKYSVPLDEWKKNHKIAKDE